MMKKRRGGGENEKDAKWETKYSKLILRKAGRISEDVHKEVQEAFWMLQEHACLFRDLVRIKGKDFVTPVSRLLIGNPGCTYKYLNTRLFTVPWPVEGYKINYSHPEISRACQALIKLNEHLRRETVLALQERDLPETKGTGHSVETERHQEDAAPVTEKGSALQDQSISCIPKDDSADRTSYNLTLLNYMDPRRMPSLKQEPYFGMGKMAVSWHHDENLVERSTVAVYSYSCEELDSREKNGWSGRDLAVWHVALKVAWDIETPRLALPLYQRDSYFMLDDMNLTHQHCVLAGQQPRFSSTHQVAEGTLPYILGRCNAALDNLHSDADLGCPALKSLDIGIIKQVEEIHNEVEFEWLRQFWFQGKRYQKCTDWWDKPLTALEEHWRTMELCLLLRELRREEQMEEQRKKRIECLLPLLENRQELRQEWFVSSMPSITFPYSEVKDFIIEPLKQKTTKKPETIRLGRQAGIPLHTKLLGFNTGIKIKTVMVLDRSMKEAISKDGCYRCHSPLALSLPEEEKPRCHPYWEVGDNNLPLPFNLKDIVIELQKIMEG